MKAEKEIYPGVYCPAVFPTHCSLRFTNPEVFRGQTRNGNERTSPSGDGGDLERVCVSQRAAATQLQSPVACDVGSVLSDLSIEENPETWIFV